MGTDFTTNYLAMQILPLAFILSGSCILLGIFLSIDLILRILFLLIGIILFVVAAYGTKKWNDSYKNKN